MDIEEILKDSDPHYYKVRINSYDGTFLGVFDIDDVLLLEGNYELRHLPVYDFRYCGILIDITLDDSRKPIRLIINPLNKE